MRFAAVMTLATAIVALPLMGVASAPKLTDGNFVRASRCVTLAGFPEINTAGLDASALETQVEKEKFRRAAHIESAAREEIRATKLKVRRSKSPAAIAGLQEELAKSCAGLI